MQLPAQQREQAGLAAAVGTHEAGLPARMELDIDVLQQAAGAARQCQVAQLQQGGFRVQGRGTRILAIPLRMRGARLYGTIRALDPGHRRLRHLPRPLRRGLVG